MDSDNHETSRERFSRVREAFARASRVVCSESRYHFADAPVRLRVAGETLSRHIAAPFTHLRCVGLEAEACLTIDLWDVNETRVSPPATVSHALGQTWDMGDSVFATSLDRSIVSQELGGSVVWFDRQERHIVGWFADGNDLSLHQRAKPLQSLLALWASDRGLQAVHAALVARNGRGVLMPGRSGAGKSTAALCCLAAGYTYVADDWVGVGYGDERTLCGHGLYGTASLDPTHAVRLPLFAAHAVPPNGRRDPKSLVLLSHIFQGRLDRSATLCALALPRIVDVAQTRLSPASQKDALLTLVASSVFTMLPRGGRASVERLARLARELPAYWLDIGPDLRQVSQRVDEVLAEVATRNRPA